MKRQLMRHASRLASGTGFKTLVLLFAVVAIAVFIVPAGREERLVDDATKGIANPDEIIDGQYEPSSSYVNTYYVSPSGDDASVGTEEALPLRSINKALEYAKPGDVIRLGDGEYIQTVDTKRSGEDGRPITLIGSAKAIVKGVSDEGRVIEIKHSYIALVGFTVDGLSGSSEDIDSFRDKLIYAIGTEPRKGVEGLLIDGMTIQNAGGECVRLRYFATRNVIKNSTIRNCGVHDFRLGDGSKNGEGIYIGTAPEQTGDGKNPTAEIDESNLNYVHNNLIETHGNECVDIKEGSSHNLVERNTCRFQLDTESAGLDARGSYNIFRYNLVENTNGAGVRLGGDEQDDGVGNEVYENTLTDNRNGGVKIMRFPQGRICGNILDDISEKHQRTYQNISIARPCDN